MSKFLRLQPSNFHNSETMYTIFRTNESFSPFVNFQKFSSEVQAQLGRRYTIKDRSSKTKSTEQKKKTNAKFHFLKIYESDFPEIRDFMRKSFYPDEPLIKSSGLYLKPNPILDCHIAKFLKHNQSIMAKCKETGLCAGVALIKVSTPWLMRKEIMLARSIPCKKTRQLVEFLLYVKVAPRSFQKYNTDNIVRLECLAVAPKYRGKGLATKLAKESISRSRKQGFKYLSVEATNVCVAKICQNIGLKKVLEVPYDSYLDEQKKQIFEVPFPDVSCQVFIGELDKIGVDEEKIKEDENEKK